MALSDKGRLQEARALLGRLVALNPGHARAWIAIGVANARSSDPAGATAAFRRVVALDPSDGHGRKNLGAALAQSGENEAALEHLRSAVNLLPSDPEAWFNLAATLEALGDLSGADEAYERVIRLDPAGRLSRRSEEGRSRIAHSIFRQRGHDFRPDALSYCLGALQRFNGMPAQEIQRITFEIAMLGTRGLDVNDSAAKYTLGSLPGAFSGLHLLCVEYVGFQILDPSVDIGFDLSKEYAEARKLHEAGGIG